MVRSYRIFINVPVHSLLDSLGPASLTPSMVTFMGGHIRPILYLIGSFLLSIRNPYNYALSLFITYTHNGFLKMFQS